MVTYGMVPVLGHKWSASMDPLLFGGLASIAGAFPLLAGLGASNHHGDLLKIRFFPYFLGLAIFNTLATAFFFLGTARTTGMNTGLLLQLEPFYSMILGALFLGEAFELSQGGAVALMVAGAALIVYRGASAFNAGDLLILAVPLFQQLSHVVTKQILHKLSAPTVIPAVRLLLSGVVISVFAATRNPSALQALSSPSVWLSVLVFGLIFRGLDCYLWYEAIARIPLVRASALIPVSAAISFAGAMLILGEPAEPRHYKGIGLILAGLLWLSWLQLRERSKVLDAEPI
jgi:drug/metabolite transporter (DMT)-like permease